MSSSPSRTLLAPSEAKALGMMVGRFTLPVPVVAFRQHSNATVFAEGPLGFLIARMTDGSFGAGVSYNRGMGHGLPPMVRWLRAVQLNANEEIALENVPFYFGYLYDQEALLTALNQAGESSAEMVNVTRLDNGTLRFGCCDATPLGTHEVEALEVMFPQEIGAGD